MQLANCLLLEKVHSSREIQLPRSVSEHTLAQRHENSAGRQHIRAQSPEPRAVFHCEWKLRRWTVCRPPHFACNINMVSTRRRITALCGHIFGVWREIKAYCCANKHGMMMMLSMQVQQQQQQVQAAGHDSVPRELARRRPQAGGDGGCGCTMIRWLHPCCRTIDGMGEGFDPDLILSTIVQLMIDAGQYEFNTLVVATDFSHMLSLPTM